MIQGDMPDDERKLQALCNAVIAAAVTEDEDEDSVSLLTALLSEEGVDPNAGNDETWDKVSRPPPSPPSEVQDSLLHTRLFGYICCFYFCFKLAVDRVGAEISVAVMGD